MAYPASTTALSRAVHEAHEIMLSVKSAAQSLRDNSSSGDVNATAVLSMRDRCIQALTRLNAIAALPGIGQQAQAELNDDTIDVGAEFNAVISALEGVRDWITTNFPQDGEGYLLYTKFGSSRTFTTAETAGLRTELDGLIATIA